MNNIALFYLLKKEILLKYREHFPYYEADIHAFGNREIAQLIDCIEKERNERVSEKWIYTHLKPLHNQKLPRRDMLEIFCRWLGYSDWDEFVHKHKNVPAENVTVKGVDKKKKLKIFIFMGVIAAAIGAAVVLAGSGGKISVCFKDKYTRKEIPEGSITVHLLADGSRQKLKRDGDCYLMNAPSEESRLIVESPYYKTDTLTVAAGADHAEFDLQPDDYAMMLRAYMNGNTADWKKRKEQLNGILSDDAVIEEVMFDDIGVEFLNKEEFINKITMPTKVSQGMEIIETKYENGKIVSLKYMQKEK